MLRREKKKREKEKKGDIRLFGFDFDTRN